MYGSMMRAGSLAGCVARAQVPSVARPVEPVVLTGAQIPDYSAPARGNVPGQFSDRND